MHWKAPVTSFLIRAGLMIAPKKEKGDEKSSHPSRRYLPVSKRLL